MNVLEHERYRELVTEFVKELAREAANSSRGDVTATGAIVSKILIGLTQMESERDILFPKPTAVSKKESK